MNPSVASSEVRAAAPVGGLSTVSSSRQGCSRKCRSYSLLGQMWPLVEGRVGAGSSPVRVVCCPLHWDRIGSLKSIQASTRFWVKHNSWAVRFRIGFGRRLYCFKAYTSWAPIMTVCYLCGTVLWWCISYFKVCPELFSLCKESKPSVEVTAVDAHILNALLPCIR